MTASARNEYDIVIAGGGMIGSCLALALAPLDLRVAVVEAVARDVERQPSFDDRSTALSRSSQRMFEAMGLWPDIQVAATPITRIHVSERGSFGFAHIDAAEQGVEALGHVVVNRVLGQVLQRSMPDVGGLVFLCPARISSVALTPSGAQVTVDRGDRTEELSCSLLVAADGAQSSVREMIGIGAEHKRYGQQAIIGNIASQYAPENRAFERFVPGGALALLPTAEQRMAFVWALADDAAAGLMELPDVTFTARLQSAFGFRLGRFQQLGQRASYPLYLSRAKGLAAARSVLVGNAAHGLHPLAAQGFNLGLRDVAALSECIADALTGGGSEALGGDAMLERYCDWRTSDHRKVVYFTDGLVRLFGGRSPALRALRGVGMLGFDLLPGVRRLFARHTMGLAGRLPRLSRGVPLK